MTHYAQTTRVPVDRSRAEVHKLLRRYGATRIADAWEQGGNAAVQFEIGGYVARLSVPVPSIDELKARPRIQKSPAALRSRVAQEERQRWRALGLLLKAKFESVSLGLSTFEQEFLAAIVLDSGRTVGSEILKRLGHASGFELALPAKGETSS